MLLIYADIISKQIADKIYNQFIISISMGYNSYCYSQNCFYNCCMVTGWCPTYSYQCYYYYYNSTTTTTSGGTIAGAVVGAVIGVIIILAIACYCYRKRQQQALQEQMMMQNANRNISQAGTTIILPGAPIQQNYSQPMQPSTFGQPMPQQPYGQSFGQPYNQQPYGQPYGQNMVQPQNPLILNM